MSKRVEARSLPRPLAATEHLSVIQEAHPEAPLFFTPFHNRRAYLRAKRILDVCVSFTLLVLLAPLLAVIALLIRLDSPGPVIYRQQRLGLNRRHGERRRGKGSPGGGSADVLTERRSRRERRLHDQGARVFTLFKFRTMHTGADAGAHRQYVQQFIRQSGQSQAEPSPRGKSLYKLTGDARVTRVGRFLRRTSLDELPQFWNVLLGDMSLVGPRPPLPYEVELYQDWHKRRLRAWPGLTGWWQIKGRSRVAFDEMVRMDLYYVENCSLGLDLKIMLLTPWAVLTGRGAV